MQGVFAGATARIAAGFGIVGCAVVIALAAGGASVFGGLGSLFGKSGDSLQVARAADSRADIVATPATTTLEAASVTVRRTGRTRGPARSRKPAARRAPRANPAPPASGQPAPAAPPAPAPALPTPPPAPSPGRGQLTSTIAETVKQLGGQAPPQAAPITTQVDEVVDALVQTCQSLPACP